MRSAGAVFLGRHAATAFADYAAGTNHVLPTGGSARFSQGLSVDAFVRRVGVVEIDAQSARALAPPVSTIAREEGLRAHALSVELRAGISSECASSEAAPAGGWPASDRMAAMASPATMTHDSRRKALVADMLLFSVAVFWGATSSSSRSAVERISVDRRRQIVAGTMLYLLCATWWLPLDLRAARPGAGSGATRASGAWAGCLASSTYGAGRADGRRCSTRRPACRGSSPA